MAQTPSRSAHSRPTGSFPSSPAGRLSAPFEIQAVRVGDMAWTTCRVELFQDYGVRIQARSLAVQTAVVQLMGDPLGEASYLPPADAEAGGGYSANLYCNEFGTEGGDQLVEKSLTLLHELFPGKPIQPMAPANRTVVS